MLLALGCGTYLRRVPLPNPPATALGSMLERRTKEAVVSPLREADVVVLRIAGNVARSVACTRGAAAEGLSFRYRQRATSFRGYDVFRSAIYPLRRTGNQSFRRLHERMPPARAGHCQRLQASCAALTSSRALTGQRLIQSPAGKRGA